MTFPEWLIDKDGRIGSVKSFAHGDFADTPLFVKTALEHNARRFAAHNALAYRMELYYGLMVKKPDEPFVRMVGYI